jgi:hypothetical protein
MDEEIILEPQKSAPDPNAAPTEEESADVDQVFDVNPDLTISPVKDYGAPDQSAQDFPAETPPPMTFVPAPMPPIAVVPPELPASPIPPVAAAPVAASPVAAVESVPPRPIPLQDFSASLGKARTTPASPPAKTVDGSSTLSAAELGLAPPKQSLQSALRAMPRSGAEALGPAPNATAAEENPNVKTIRTFEGDVADVLAHKRTSTASIAIAESSKAEGAETLSTSEPPSHAVRNIIFFLLSLCIIGGGIYGAYYLYSQSPLAPSTEPQATPPSAPTSLIPSDSRVLVATDGLSGTAVTARIKEEAAKSQPNGTIKEIIPVTVREGTTLRLSAAATIDLMELPIPDILKRSLNPNWMLGEYSDPAGQKIIFVVVTNNFFQNAFAGMLSWESAMPNDIKQYIYGPSSAVMPPVPLQQPAADLASSSGIFSTSNAATSSAGSATSSPKTATTSTSTLRFIPLTNPSIAPGSLYFTVRGRFEDRIIGNKDVREFISSDGQVLFLYSFLDTSKLVVAGNEAALVEILSRLEKQAFVR